MPSPFPEMDPFLENQEWVDFHHAAIEVIREFLTPLIGESYIVRVERRIYMEHRSGDDELRIADVAMIDEPRTEAGSVATAVATLAAPVEDLLPMPEEQRELYLLIKDRESKDVITVIVLLSPNNKRRTSNGREEYLQKRESILQSRSHLVELGLLRGGERLPMRSQLTEADYYAIISRGGRRPKADVYAWPLKNPLLTIPIPLKPPDPDVNLNLQDMLSTVYDRAQYDLSARN